MARRPSGFSIVELLVSIALIALLAAIFIPVSANARASAMKVVCLSRLRDLTLACNLYRTDHFAYPLQPGTTISPQPVVGTLSILPTASSVTPPTPTDMDSAFLNALSSYLRFPRVEPTDEPTDLPHVVQCPTIEDVDDADRTPGYADLSLTHRPMYTGYAYCARPADSTLVPVVKLLKPKRIANNASDERAVVWADDLHWTAGDGTWYFVHTSPRAMRGRRSLSYANRQGLLGQHRAYTDGSVEWVDQAEIDLDIANDKGAARKRASLSVFDLYFYWF